MALAASLRLRRARRANDAARELAARRSAAPLLALEHGLLAVALLAGLGLMASRGWGLGQARWLGLKLGLVAFLQARRRERERSLVEAAVERPA